MNASCNWLPIDSTDNTETRPLWRARTPKIEKPQLQEMWKAFADVYTSRTAQAASEVECLCLDWLPRAIEIGPNNYDVDHLAEVVAAIDRELCGGRYSLLGRAIDGLPVELLSPHVLSTVLRVASAAKHLIPNWYNIVEDVHERLSMRGFDANRILRGLA